MPDQSFEPEVKYEVLENDMKKLAAEIKAIKVKAESNHISEQEIIKKSLSALVPVHSKNTQAAQQQASSSPLPQYAESFSPETKLEIEYLLDMAFREGITKALDEAQKSQNPLILDAFHDALAGKLHPELKKRGIL
jgi:hypothetical protein